MIDKNVLIFHGKRFRKLYVTYWYLDINQISGDIQSNIIMSKQDINSVYDDDNWNSYNYFSSYGNALACLCDLTGV